jgi:hypothetical protein
MRYVPIGQKKYLAAKAAHGALENVVDSTRDGKVSHHRRLHASKDCKTIAKRAKKKRYFK